MSKYYCLNCHKDILNEGTLAEMFYVDDVLCQQCRQLMEYYPKRIRIGKLKVTSLYVYDGFVREMLIQYKEYKDEALFPIFIYPYVSWIKDEYKDYVLVPIPSSQLAYKERGFNHIQQIFSLLNMEIVDVLYKDDKSSQKQLHGSQRREILKHMHLKSEEKIINKKVLIIDDIITTGSSLEAAYTLLNKKAKKCIALTIAYNISYLNIVEKWFVKNHL